MKPLYRLLPLAEEQVDQLHRLLYLLGLATIACGLAWSNALMSIGQFILAGNWLLEADFEAKWARSKQQRHLGLLLSIFALVLAGFLWTENLDYALKDARIKLPLLLLPLFIGSTARLKIKELRAILGVYLITLSLLYLSSLLKYFGLFSEASIQDKRELSIFISHIRYGLNLLLGSLLAIYYSPLLTGTQLMKLSKKGESPNIRRRPKRIWLLYMLALTLFTSLVVLELYTALLIGLLIVGTYLLKVILFGKLNPLVKSSAIMLILLTLTTAIVQVRQVAADFHRKPEMSYDQDEMIKFSKLGNPYTHKRSDQRKENGVFLYRYLQEEELAKQWEEKSSLAFNDLDQKGNPVRKTLIRFLSAKGLSKDAEGMKQLTKEEIRAIEKGIPNPYYLEHWAWQNRLYTTIYELETYRRFGYAEGFSLGMRLEFWKTAKKIIAEQPLLGVGTGDVQDAFDLQYYLDQSSLSEKNRRRAHNQYLTIWLTYGVFGLLYFLFYLLWPLKGNEHGFYPAFLAIVMLSFLTEDTLETQAGVTFFAFFNSLFVLGFPQEDRD